MTLWIKIVTGQNSLNYIQSKISNISPLCRFCEEEDEAFFHFMTDCLVFQQTRTEIMLTTTPLPREWTIPQILRLTKTKAIKFALSFENNEN